MWTKCKSKTRHMCSSLTTAENKTDLKNVFQQWVAVIKSACE